MINYYQTYNKYKYINRKYTKGKTQNKIKLLNCIDVKMGGNVTTNISSNTV